MGPRPILHVSASAVHPETELQAENGHQVGTPAAAAITAALANEKHSRMFRMNWRSYWTDWTDGNAFLFSTVSLDTSCRRKIAFDVRLRHFVVPFPPKAVLPRHGGAWPSAAAMAKLAGSVCHY